MPFCTHCDHPEILCQNEYTPLPWFARAGEAVNDCDLVVLTLAAAVEQLCGDSLTSHSSCPDCVILLRADDASSSSGGVHAIFTEAGHTSAAVREAFKKYGERQRRLFSSLHRACNAAMRASRLTPERGLTARLDKAVQVDTSA